MLAYKGTCSHAYCAGITNPEFEERMASEGIKVVADRCLMVDLM